MHRTEQEIYRTQSISLDEPFAAGFDIESLINSTGGNLSTFFGNQNSNDLMKWKIVYTVYSNYYQCFIAI